MWPWRQPAPYVVGTLRSPVSVTLRAAAPAAPTVINPAGSGTGASFEIAPAVDGAAKYVVTPYKNGVAQAPMEVTGTAVSLATADVGGADAYSFTVAAKTSAGEVGPTTRVPDTGFLAVGTPLRPTSATATGGIGLVTLSFMCVGGAQPNTRGGCSAGPRAHLPPACSILRAGLPSDDCPLPLPVHLVPQCP